jgi:hypothetical protein
MRSGRNFPDAPPRDVRVLCADARLRIGFHPGGIPKLAGLARARDAGLAAG